jgi:2-oxoglutarate dehydrogenase E2 component (dihydrolipoamide succinyltransferase)
MSIEIKAPQFPESVADGTVATWHKKEGDRSAAMSCWSISRPTRWCLKWCRRPMACCARSTMAEGATIESQAICWR